MSADYSYATNEMNIEGHPRDKYTLMKGGTYFEMKYEICENYRNKTKYHQRENMNEEWAGVAESIRND